MTKEAEMEYIAQQNNPYLGTGGGLRYLCSIHEVEYSDDELDNVIRGRLLEKIQNEPKQNCKECENETMLKYSSLYCDYDNALERIRLLEDGLRTTRKLCDFYSNRCNELENLVKLYKEKCEMEE